MAEESVPQKSPAPYVGPQPFERGQEDFFFGRNRESDDLFSLVASHREVLLYAASGAGKTSLLNAGLFPKLEEEGIKVLGPARVSGPLPPESAHLKEIANPFVFNVLRAWSKDKENVDDLISKSLGDFLPQDGQERVLIFDQLEEIFEFFPERWPARRDFFEQVGKLLREQPEIRVVFSIRQDYLANLLRFTEVLPERLKTRFHLERLRKEPALQAIAEPLKKLQPPKVFAPGVAENLVEDLLKVWVLDEARQRIRVTGEVVEPVQLQVVCQRLWNQLKDGIEKTGDVEIITEEHRKKVGNVTEALSLFYVDCLRRAMEISSETKEHRLRKFFGEKLITPVGTRALVYGGGKDVEGIPYVAINALVGLHLIRKEPRAGADWYELNHDRFIEPIQNSNEIWLKERQAALGIRTRLEERAQAWARSGRRNEDLLDEVDYREADRWINSPEAEELGFSRKLWELVAASGLQIQKAAEAIRHKAEQQEREAILSRQRAEFERQRAEEQKRLAEAESQRAESERLRAEAETKRAEIERLRAEEQRERAETESLRAEQERRGKQSLAFRTAVMAALALLALVLLFGALKQRNRSYSQELAVAAMNTSEIDPDLSVLLALRAYSLKIPFLAPTDEAVQALQQAVVSSRTRFIFNPHIGDPASDPPKSIYGVAFRPQGDFLATVGSDMAVRIWDVSDASSPGKTWDEQTASKEKLRHTLTGHTAPVIGLAFSPDGMLLATSSFDGTAKVWDWNKEEVRQTLNGHGQQPVVSVAFSSDGKLLATASWDKTAKVWDSATGQELLTLTVGSIVNSVAFSRDGRLVTSGMDGKVKIWNSTDGTEIPAIKAIPGVEGHQGAVYSAVFSPDEKGSFVATSGFDQTAKIWDSTTGELVNTLRGHSNILGVVTFSPDGKFLATASADGTAKLWDRETGKELLTLNGHKGLVFGVAFSPNPNNNFLATASWDGTARVWNIAGGFDLIGHTDEIKAVAYSRDGKFIASGSRDGTAKIWDAASRSILKTFKCGDASKNYHINAVNAVAFSPQEGKHLIAVGCIDGTAKVWDWEGKDETPLFVLKTRGDPSPVLGIAYSPDARNLIATSYGDGAVRVWESASPQQELYKLVGGPSPLTLDVAFSLDGKRLAAASSSGIVKEWDMASGQELRELKRHDGLVNAVAFSPDGKLATASSDRSAKLWDESGAFVSAFTFNGHKGAVNDVAFNSDGTLAATASSDGTIKVWDLSTGTPKHTFSGHKGIVNTVAFSPDGKYLACAGVDESIHLNILDMEQLKKEAEKRKVRAMSEVECQTYLHGTDLCSELW